MSNSVPVFILAGGKSSRMKTNKALLPWGDSTIIESLIKAVKEMGNPLQIIGDRCEYPDIDIPCLYDSVNDAGPAAGILTAMLHARHNYAIVLSCDMPWAPRLIHQLLLHQDADVCLFHTQDKQFPFPGKYSTQIKFVWADMLARGERKVGNFINYFAVKSLPCQDELLLTNINFPVDYENAKKINDGN